MPLKEIIVFVYMPNTVKAVPAGIFYYDSLLEIGEFVYSNRYVNRSDALPVDPIAIPLGVEPLPESANSGIYGAFRDAAPDYWGRLIIASELNTAPEALSELDFLLQANATRVGNLDFRNSPDSAEPELAPPAFEQISHIIDAADNIAAGMPVEKHLLHLLRQGSSIGGARPKCTVEWNSELWLAKFSAKGDTVNIPCIEYATMKLARECGIKIPDVRLQLIDGKNVFLIRRFDRQSSRDGWLRKGFISSLSLMRIDEKDRLKWSYLTIASLMRKHCSKNDIKELFLRMIFNIMIRNTDDHPRNHGFLFTESNLTLSPAYDILPSFILSGVGTEFNLAMTVGEFGKQATIENALSKCEHFGLARAEAIEAYENMRIIILNWKEFFRENSVIEKEIDLLEPSFSL